MIALEQVKSYLRIDSDDEDELLQNLMSVAGAYLEDAIEGYKLIYEYDEVFARKADFLQMVMTAELYQNRSGDPRGDFAFTIRSLLSQLQHWTRAVEDLEQMRAITFAELESLIGGAQP